MVNADPNIGDVANIKKLIPPQKRGETMTT
jgi:hypothetical protein